MGAVVLDSGVKPEEWPVESALIDPKWGLLHDAILGLWPMWDGGGSRVSDLSQYKNHGAYTVAGGDGGWATGPDGPITTYVGGDDFVDTGVEEINNIGLFADSSEQWTVVVRYRTNTENGTIVGRATGTGSDRTFQIFNLSGSGPQMNIRGSTTNPGWGLTDNLFHTVFVSWDGATARGSYDGIKGETTLTVGTAIENVGERIIFGARTNGTGFRLENGAIDFVCILGIALAKSQKIMIANDFYGLFRMRVPMPFFVPAVGGGFIPYPNPRYALTGGMQPMQGGV